MPVECSIEIAPLGQEEFHAVDRVVMGHVFDIHNTLGRFCDERIYQEELAQRCLASSFEVHREVLLRVSHESFVKPYYLDMLVQGGAVYELKAVEALHGSHQKQLINYLLLAGLNHGKLVTFRPRSIESRFVSTRLRRSERMAYRVIDSEWRSDDEPARRLRSTLSGLLDDWGTFLDADLYREALLYLLDSPEAGVQPVEIEVAGKKVGTQNMCILSAGTAWHLSAVREHLTSYETHMMRLLSHTRLDRMHWINLDQRVVTLRTLEK